MMVAARAAHASGPLLLLLLLSSLAAISTASSVLLRRTHEEQAQATLRVDLKDSSSGLLIPNYKGKQTFGLEMESNCAFTGRALDKHADYAAMAMVVYRKETVDGLSIPIGMMEVESHGNLEGMTFPARALDPADAKDVKCMIYFAYRLHRKTKLASMWKKAKETTTLEDLVNSITKADALDDTVAKPEGCTFLEVVFGTFDPGTATQAELAEEADKDNHAVRSQSGKFMCVGYRGKLLRRDLKKTDAFCDFRSLKIKSRCRKNIFPQLNAHVNIRKFYGPEGASTRLLNRPTAGKKYKGRPEDFFFAQQAAKEAKFFTEVNLLPKTDTEFERMNNEILSLPGQLPADLHAAGGTYTIPEPDLKFRPGYQQRGHGRISSGKPFRWPSPIDPKTKTPFTICDALYNIQHEQNMQPRRWRIWDYGKTCKADNECVSKHCNDGACANADFAGTGKNVWNWLPKFMVNTQIMKAGHVKDQPGFAGPTGWFKWLKSKVCQCPKRSTKWTLGDEMDKRGRVQTEPCSFNPRGTGIPLVHDCPPPKTGRFPFYKKTYPGCSYFGLVELRAYPLTAVTAPLVYGLRTDGPIVQSGEELDRSELLEKSEAVASKNLVARIELFYRKMKRFYKKVMTKDGEPAQTAVKQQHGDGDGNDDDDNDDDASDHETDE